jgi:endogenous inhibitor of DNA gyrase (YacG/DUF329 family)
VTSRPHRRKRKGAETTEQILARTEQKLRAIYDQYTVGCPHCGKPILASMFASATAKRASAMRKSHGAGTGRPKKLSPCPDCGKKFGVAEMRKHRAQCRFRRMR